MRSSDERGLDLGDVAPVVGDGFTISASGRYVQVGDRLVPETVTVELAGDAATPTTIARAVVRDGVPRVVSLTFESREGEGEVRQSHLRATQLDALLDLVAGFSVRVTEATDDRGLPVVEIGVSDDGDPRPEAVAAVRGARGNRKVTDALLREVAEVYRSNMDAPTKAVRERYFVSERMASKYVQAARARGFLPPTTQGKKQA